MKGYLPIAEAVKAGYGSRTRLWRLASLGRIRTIKQGQFVFYNKEDLEALNDPQQYLTENQIIDNFLDDLAKNAPKLTPQHKEKLAALLRG